MCGVSPSHRRRDREGARPVSRPLGACTTVLTIIDRYNEAIAEQDRAAANVALAAYDTHCVGCKICNRTGNY